MDQFDTILAGNCNIIGRSPYYSGQPFYTSLVNSNDSIVRAMDNSTIEQILSLDKYSISVSLKQQQINGGYYYKYDLVKNKYFIDVSCSNNGITTQQLANILDMPLDNSQYNVIDINNTTQEVNNTIVFSKGWSLAGAFKDINLTNIQCKDSQIRSIWKYQNNSWLLHTTLQNSLSLDDFNSIKTAEGFWVDCY